MGKVLDAGYGAGNCNIHPAWTTTVNAYGSAFQRLCMMLEAMTPAAGAGVRIVRVVNTIVPAVVR